MGTIPWMELLSITFCLGLSLRTWCSTQAYLLLPDSIDKPMLTQEDKIRLFREYRSALFERMFDELCRKSPGWSAEQISRDIVASAEVTPGSRSVHNKRRP